MSVFDKTEDYSNGIEPHKEKQEVKGKTLTIYRLVASSMADECVWFDFKEIPQGYIKMNGTPIPRPKGMRRMQNGIAVHNGNYFYNPTDEQVIAHAKRLMSKSDIFNTISEHDPDDFNFVVKDYLGENDQFGN